MGLFSSKKRTYVSSSVWNMAGDIKDRANYLKSVVMGNMLFDSSTSLGEAIPSAYLNGPGMGFRRYARWARGSSNYDDNVGFVGGGVRMGNSLDPATLQAQIPHGPTEFVILGENDIGWADYTWWAEEYMVNNHQDLLFTDWFAEIADVTMRSPSPLPIPQLLRSVLWTMTQAKSICTLCIRLSLVGSLVLLCQVWILKFLMKPASLRSQLGWSCSLILTLRCR